MIPIPQNLRKCVQTFDAPDIKIRHHLGFKVQLHNPDGHMSEIHATLPVYVFLSPNLPIDENNNIISSSAQRAVDGASELANLTPPQYGKHTFDRLYSEIDPSGYMTPGAQSGATSPLDSRSRSVSSENLASMNAMAISEITPSALHQRLTNLDAAGPAGVLRTARDRAQLSSFTEDATEQIPSNGHLTSTGTSFGSGFLGEQNGSLAGQTLDDENLASDSPQHIEYSAESLAKVPSYSTALQSDPRTPLNEGLPTYQAATQTAEQSSTSSRGPYEACPEQRSTRSV